jgi:hypothetical protein
MYAVKVLGNSGRAFFAMGPNGGPAVFQRQGGAREHSRRMRENNVVSEETSLIVVRISILEEEQCVQISKTARCV